jgi:regulator of protease activity HflC (stomatin/prohibitin superfamily)
MTMAPADEHAASERRARDQAEPNGAWAQSAKLAFRFLFLAVAVTAIGWGVSNVRQVPPDSRAVVLRFGNIVRQQGAGLLIAWPRPIEEVVLLPSADRQIEFKINRFEGNASFGGGRTVMGSVPFGGQDSNGNQTDDLSVTIDSFRGFNMIEDPRQNAGFLLTGDSSVVHLQATLFYQITDPAAYLIAADHVAPALERLFVASAVSVCASRDLDTILVARPEASDTGNDNSRSSREQLRADLMNAVNQRLQNLMEQGVGLGITVSRVDLVPAIPSGAKSAFDLVLIATQWAERDIAQARTDAETTAQKANRESDRIITDATAQAEEVVTQAKTRTAAIAALAEQTPGLSGQMLINRIYYDRVGALLKKAGGVDTVDHDGTSHLILPGPVQK